MVIVIVKSRRPHTVLRTGPLDIIPNVHAPLSPTRVLHFVAALACVHLAHWRPLLKSTQSVVEIIAAVCEV